MALLIGLGGCAVKIIVLSLEGNLFLRCACAVKVTEVWQCVHVCVRELVYDRGLCMCMRRVDLHVYEVC